jgi:disulfide bond formation protein DsbB
MDSTVNTLLVNGTLVSHFVLLILVAAFVFRKTWGREVTRWVYKHVLLLGLLVSGAAVFGSLLLSNLVGFPPCELCWWQRIALYPNAVLFLVALKKKQRDVFSHVIPLVLIALLISAYHTYAQLGGQSSLLPCVAAGGECAKVYVKSFGYITIPTMSLTVVLYLIYLYVVNKFAATE